MAWDLQKLFRRHSGEIARSLRHRGLSEETAADLTQDTFLRILISPPGESAAAHNPAAYLFRVARNLGVDYLRRERLLPRADLLPDDFATIVDSSPSPEATVYDRQRLALTAAALSELPERTRRAFEMHRLDEMTIAAIAAELELSISRTWSLIRDAYEHVGARLAGI